jgi:transcriptional regulator with XRE-family HTH domain
MSNSKRFYKLTPSKEFGKYLRGLRIQNTELSQAEAARRVGLKPGQLNYIERGERAPNDILPLIKLAQLYHVSPDEIIRRAYWPQLLLLPLVAIIEPQELTSDLIEELQKGLEDNERQDLTKYIEKLLCKRSARRTGHLSTC